MEWIRGTFIGGMVMATTKFINSCIDENETIQSEMLHLKEQAENNAEYRTKLDRSFAEYKAGLGQKHELLDVKDI